MAKLNLIFLASLLLLVSSALAAKPAPATSSPAKPAPAKPAPSPSPVAEAPAEGPVDLESIIADAPTEALLDMLGPQFDENGPLSTAAKTDQELMQAACFKQLIDLGGSEDCLLDLVSVLSPKASSVSGMVPLPDKICCKSFVTLDHQAPECWTFLVRGAVVDDRLTHMREVCITQIDI